MKRVFRIIPAYAVVLLLYFLVPSFKEWESLPPLWRFVTFTQNFGLDLSKTRTFSHAWSLCIEEQFYFVLPLLSLLFLHFKAGKKAALLIPVLFIAGFIFRILSWQKAAQFIDTDSFGIEWYKWVYYPTYNRLDGLLAGISIAGMCRFYPAVKQFIDKRGNLLLLTGLALLTCAYFLCLEPFSFGASVFGFPLASIGYGCCVAAAISSSCFLSRFRSRISFWIATLSYGIYLIHKAIIHQVQAHCTHAGLASDSSIVFLISVAASILGALLLYYVIERPFMAYRRRLLSAKTR